MPYLRIVLPQELRPGMIEPMKPSFTLIQSEIQDGDIICFQVEISEADVRQLETQGLHSNPLQFYDFLQNRVDILFKPKFYEPDADHPEFSLVLSKEQNYDVVRYNLLTDSTLGVFNLSLSDGFQGRGTTQACVDKAEVYHNLLCERRTQMYPQALAKPKHQRNGLPFQSYPIQSRHPLRKTSREHHQPRDESNCQDRLDGCLQQGGIDTPVLVVQDQSSI